MWLEIIGSLLILAVVLLLFWRFWFLRMPARKIPGEGIVSPASGKIIRIIRYKDGTPLEVPKGLLGKVRTLTKDVAKSGHVVVIMLTAMDVHYQRSPIRGSISLQRHSKGSLHNAVFGSGSLRASFENEKNEILLTDGKRKAKVVQVAGILARRIVSYVEKGQKVDKGEILGLINLGSQVLLILPECEIKAREGDTVVDGESVIACWRS